MPTDLGTVSGRQPQQTDGDGEASQADGAILGIVILEFGRQQRDGGDQDDQDDPAGEEAPSRRDGVGRTADHSFPDLDQGREETV